LFAAIASLRQKLDNVMPTLTGAEEAVQLARYIWSQSYDRCAYNYIAGVVVG
jgi:hypothetical protein